MARQRVLGITIFILCIVGFFVYAYMLMLSEWSPVVLQLSVLMAIGGILGVISWIGYSMATSKPPSSSSVVSDEKK